ncbi:MAG TPA: STELLO glycosyltransferase family protein [Phycisphaerales bacterium]|nr:STELLO glycosyltransferase family protein [Phycisphaerales bacterium]
MAHRPTLVVTSIAGDSHPILNQLARGAKAAGWRFLVMGDTKSPATFSLADCEFMSVAQQVSWGESHNLKYAAICPTRHYARKNIGYLEAIRAGTPYIVETDDDNYPTGSDKRKAKSENEDRGGTFFGPRSLVKSAKVLRGCGWVNLYRYWSATDIWPRGLPLDCVQKDAPSVSSLSTQRVACPIQQGLADDNPDVDAIYRLIRPLPIVFDSHESVAIARDAWCPFNSQNTTFFPQAFPLLYLPALCSFRMTDIWRSFVAQRVCQVNDWPVLFHDATVRQLRNDHNLMRDFEDEVSGYTQNAKICAALGALELKAGEQYTSANVRACFAELVSKGFLPERELELLDAWLHDLAKVGGLTSATMVEPKVGVEKPLGAR